MTNGGSRSQPLDVLRALAVLLVLGRHKDIFASWSQVGWAGVDLFFVLSGYLVSGLLFAEAKSTSRVDAKRFLVRRGFKIYPGFWILLVLTCAYLALRKGGVPTRLLLDEVFFIQNYRAGLWNHTWSLAVEEHFYLLLVVALSVMARVRPSAIGSVRTRRFILAFVVLVAIARIASVISFPYSVVLHFSGTHARLDGLLFGVWLSHLRVFSPEKLSAFRARWRPALLLGILLCVVPPFVWRVETAWMASVGYTLVYVGFGALLLVAEDTPWLRARSRPLLALAAVGRASYAIYLWHMPVADWGMTLFRRGLPSLVSPASEAVVYLVGSLAIGIVFARVVEDPLLSLRDRYFPGRGARPQLASPEIAITSAAQSSSSAAP